MLHSKNRPRWNALPPQVRDQIEQLAGGRVLAAENCEGGFSAGFASRLTLAGGRRLFAKAMDGAAWPLQAGWCRDEARVSAGLPAGIPAPGLRGWSDDGRWVALVFECIEGREPARPWRPDELGRAAAAVSAMSLALTPSPVPVPAEQPRIGGWAELAGDRAALGRLAGVSVPAARHLAELLAFERAGLAAAHGTSLVHFDVLPHNILCAGHQVWFVVWPHARLGAPFIDLLMLLGSAGSDGIDLDDLLAAQPVAAGPDRGTIDAVLAALAGFYLAGALAETAAAFRPIAAAKLELGRGTLSWLQRRLGWRA